MKKVIIILIFVVIEYSIENFHADEKCQWTVLQKHFHSSLRIINNIIEVILFPIVQ